jgi:histidinol-phosphate aminotransferase
MKREDVIDVAAKFKGIVVVDEAYIDFASEPSLITELTDLPNLVVLQTFSKAWGMAGLRVGLAYASCEIIDLMNRVKPPYNVSGIAQQAVTAALDDQERVEQWITDALQQRTILADTLGRFDFVATIHPSDANFILLKVADANALYRFLLEEKIVVRNRNNVELCEGCLRITVGTPEENERLIDAMTRFT